ncbi:HlyD family secretion protein [Photobacterium nomapromontoriensis]|uniref:HlyD family secretion protein n=1 Tax=Photobacterium nomapromontoriensis TaxID=2910237 RepID=UPI003D0AF61D
MKESVYKYAIYAVLSITIGFSLFLITADNLSPFTTQATMYRAVANIAPEVSGVITQVNVKNGETVKAGDVLFSINQHRYQLAVRQAQAELQQAKESFAAKQQELYAAEQTHAQRQLEANNAQQKLARYTALRKKGLSTQQALDDIKLNAQVTNKAVQAAHADVQRLQAELTSGNTNAAIELAQAKLDSAKLDLTHTQVLAQTDGTVSNLQLQAGTYITQGSVALFLVSESHSWLSADFNEKGIAYLQPGHPVWISFDALPGKVFDGEIINQDRAIYDASNPTNQLSSVTNDSRWIREQQKIRTRIHVDHLDPALISGSRASAMVENGNGVLDIIGACWIKLVALFRYIY